MIFAFAGNRAAVLEEMKSLGLDVRYVWAVKGSYLERYLKSNNTPFYSIDDRETLVKDITNASFDIFVSNGLPIILPISKLMDGSKKYINIHPSLLPSLRGRDPVPGAILFHKDSGATCHVMDDGIDTGPIISRVRIPISDDLDAGLLYQLSFAAERKAFRLAYESDFTASSGEIIEINDESYYSFKESDLSINLNLDDITTIISKVKAFSTGNKGARVTIDNNIYVVNDIEIIDNPFAREIYREYQNGMLVLKYENRVVTKSHGVLIKFTLKE